MKTLLISACLYGVDCKYNGGNNYLGDETLAALKAEYKLIPVCPELAAGLSVPRSPSERVGDRVMMKSGENVTKEYYIGAEIALRLCERFSCSTALLQPRSPSCGSNRIYDGSFSGILTDGDGVCAEVLKKHRIRVENEADAVLNDR